MKPGLPQDAVAAVRGELRSILEGVSSSLLLVEAIRRDLRACGVNCPPLDGRLLGTYVEYLQSVGFLPPPRVPFPALVV
jgi:hypothetical protein